MNLSIIIPLLNEEESLPELMGWIKKVMYENQYSYEVIFIDDGSKDQSWNVIQKLQSENPCIKSVKFRRNYGKSAALNVGFQRALGDIIITMDADLQDSPEEIPDFFKMIKEENFDLVSGWKKVRYDSKITKNIPSKIYNWAARKMSGIYLHDFNCGLKAYRSEVIKTIEVYGEMHRYIPVIAKWAGFDRIGEKVVIHQKRKYGVTKFGWNRFINGFLDLMSITFTSKFAKKPMHLFGLLGTLSFLIGFIMTLWVIIVKMIHIFNDTAYRQITDQPLFYLALLAMVLGTQLFLAGFLGDLIARNAGDRNQYIIEKDI
jgi:glycosyltransferase involved in cell wall biosynthesis